MENAEQQLNDLRLEVYDVLSDLFAFLTQAPLNPGEDIVKNKAAILLGKVTPYAREAGVTKPLWAEELST